MSDWDASDNEAAAPAKPTATTSAPVASVVIPRRSKFEGEDEDSSESEADDWDASSDDEAAKAAKKKAAAPAAVAPARKKGTLKQKLAEKAELERQREALIASGNLDEVEELTPQERRRIERQKELESDLANASDLLGTSSIGDASLSAALSIKPKTKADFDNLSRALIDEIYSKHTSNPLFAMFLESHAKALCESLKDSEVRKVASGLSTLANEKQKEQRDKTSGKKKPAAKAKPALGGNKAIAQHDVGVYEEALDDGDDDFM